jgi:hypothetical protein
VHGPKPSRPGNRRMATLACVYSVDPYVRGAEDVVAALFRDERERDATALPRPCHKRMTACFPSVEDAGSEYELLIRGDIQAWTWAAEQIDQRRADGQALVRLCDGQRLRVVGGPGLVWEKRIVRGVVRTRPFVADLAGPGAGCDPRDPSHGDRPRIRRTKAEGSASNLSSRPTEYCTRSRSSTSSSLSPSAGVSSQMRSCNQTSENSGWFLSQILSCLMN